MEVMKTYSKFKKRMVDQKDWDPIQIDKPLKAPWKMDGNFPTKILKNACFLGSLFGWYRRLFSE